MIWDLSLPLSATTPVYPGNPPMAVAAVGELERDGVCSHSLTVSTHLGTHIDAPMHMLPGGSSLADFGVESFVGRGRVVGIASADFREVLDLDLDGVDALLLRTGRSDHFESDDYFTSYPAMSVEVAHRLASSGLRMVGVDACSFDNTDGFPNHKILLSSGVLLVENLCNLQSLPDSGFTFSALPLSVSLDGCPVRAVAFVD